MGMPLTIQNDDNERLEFLKKKMGVKSKIEVLRRALNALEEEIERKERAQRLAKAVLLVKESSAEVNREFQKHSRLKKSL